MGLSSDNGPKMTRISAIDSCRGLAVVLAMLGHSTRQFAENVDGPNLLETLQLLMTRTATPIFMILFGIMIELVYLRKLRDGRPADQVQIRLISRMVTCYFLFAVTAFMAMITGKLLPLDTLEAMLFLGSGRFGNILKIYTGLFLLVLITLPWAIRWGARFYLSLAGIFWAVKYLFQAIDMPDPHLLHFIFGHGSGFGPSILLGVTLVAYGVLIGEALSGHRRAGPAWVMLAGAMGLLLFGAATGDPSSFIRATITTYRWDNVPYYFAYGIVACSIALAWFTLLWRIAPGAPSKAGSTVSFETLGHSTLFYYAFGNILLNLLPEYTGNSLLVAYALIISFLIALTAITLTREVLMARINPLFFGLPGKISQGYHHSVGRIAALLIRKKA